MLTGILFVLKTEIPWEDLPQEMGCGSGMTCWSRLAAWQKKGAWTKIHAVMLGRLRAADPIDWSRTAVDSAMARAVFGGPDRTQPHGSGQSRLAIPCHH